MNSRGEDRMSDRVVANPRRIRRLLREHRVLDVEFIEGRPGGPNNDGMTLHLDDGTVISADAYSPGYMQVTAHRED